MIDLSITEGTKWKGLQSGKFQAQMQRGSRSIVHDWSKVQELLTTKHPTRQAHGAESTHGEKCLELEKDGNAQLHHGSDDGERLP